MDDSRVEQLFEEALSLPLESRDAFLRDRCGPDVELLQRLRRMLEPDRTGELSALVDLAQRSAAYLDERPEASPSEGDSVGPYTLLRSIGEGTYGEVFLAAQEEPVQRQVAVKILHAGMNSAEVVRRFRGEQQSLARMDHPNIAKVYDAGVTERGLPYFVMQYVPGEPITDYCDSRRLTIEERLTLFAKVCEAVEHAHIKSVVHRDLKPSNVLVTSTDGGGPEPMVIDFGVAKVVEEGERDGTLHRTEAGRTLGTWAYMSPEQASGDPDVDTRSDVYSLGVMLYELLCGSKPFEPSTLRHAVNEELRRLIRTVEPPTPSDRLRSCDTAAASATARRTGAVELSRRLRAELELIPLYAMRKEPHRRYQRAAALGDDIRRYLGSRPLLAVPESNLYLTAKFVRRHRLVLSMTTIVAVSIVGTLLATTRSLSIARWERSRAASLASFFVDDVLGSSATQGRAGNTTITELLVGVEARLDRQLDGGTVDATDASRFYAELSRIYNRIEHREEAVRCARKSVAAMGGDLGSLADAALSAQRERAEALFKIGSADGKDEAVTLMTAIVDLLRKRGAPETDLLSAENVLAGALKARNRADDLDVAERLYQDVLTRRVALLGALHLDSLITQWDLIALTMIRADQFALANDTDRARGLREQTLDRMDSLVDDIRAAIGATDINDPTSEFDRESLGRHELIVLEEHARQLLRLARYEEALPRYEDVIPRMVDRFGSDGQRLGMARASFGRLLFRLGQDQAAMAEYREASTLLLASVGIESDATWTVFGWCVDLAVARNDKLAARERLEAIVRYCASRTDRRLSQAQCDAAVSWAEAVDAPDLAAAFAGIARWE